MTIPITVRARIACAAPQQHIVCGNSDYVLEFDYDAEWPPFYAEKTLHLHNGSQHREIVFRGTSVTLPPLQGITEVLVGVSAGNIRTAAPARIACIPCITDVPSQKEECAQDVFNCLMERISRIMK